MGKISPGAHHHDADVHVHCDCRKDEGRKTVLLGVVDQEERQHVVFCFTVAAWAEEEGVLESVGMHEFPFGSRVRWSMGSTSCLTFRSSLLPRECNKALQSGHEDSKYTRWHKGHCAGANGVAEIK